MSATTPVSPKVTLTEEQLEAIIRRATREAAEHRDEAAQRTTHDAIDAASRASIRNLFQLLGFDIDDTEQVNEVRRDLIFVRETRKRCEGISRHVIVTLIGVGALAAVAMAWEGFRMALERNP